MRQEILDAKGEQDADWQFRNNVGGDGAGKKGENESRVVVFFARKSPI